VISPREVNHLKCNCFSPVVARISEGDRQGDSPKGGGLLAQDHSIEWMRTTLELISGKSSPSKVSWYLSLKSLPPSMRALVSWVIPTSELTMRGNLLGLGYSSGGPSDQK
jgi:hypothetical protein